MIPSTLQLPIDCHRGWPIVWNYQIQLLTLYNLVKNRIYFQTAKEFKDYVSMEDEKFEEIKHLIQFPSHQIQSKSTAHKSQKATQHLPQQKTSNRSLVLVPHW